MKLCSISALTFQKQSTTLAAYRSMKSRTGPLPDGCEFQTAKEFFEAKIYDGRSIKDRWSELILTQIGGINVDDWEKP